MVKLQKRKKIFALQESSEKSSTLPALNGSYCFLFNAINSIYLFVYTAITVNQQFIKPLHKYALFYFLTKCILWQLGFTFSKFNFNTHYKQQTYV